MTARPLLGLVAFLCAAATLAGCDRPPELPDGRRRVLVLTVDTLRVDHVTRSSHPLPTMPFTDAFLDSGVVRGTGDVAIAIEYPAELRGTFSVRITTRRPRRQNQGRILSPAAAERAKARASSSSRTEHHMVSRETQFRDVRSGRYFVTADGFLQTPDQANVLATRCATRERAPR